MQESEQVKQTQRNVLGPGPGRPKGGMNKTTALLKDAILKAAEDAGDGSLVVYLTKQAKENPKAFLSLLGRVLPLQINADISGDVGGTWTVKFVNPSTQK